MNLLAIVDTMTGNTMSFAKYAMDTYPNVSIDIIDPFTVIDEDDWNKYDKIMIGCYTWDFGKIPSNTKEFIIENRDVLLTKDVLLFGSGWSIYETYCKAVDSMNIILENKFPTVKFELRFDKEVEVEAVETLKNFINN